ncbi:RxLR effector protein [Phytophthora megakarya]|uniref:RxLR effector protein n=1 Tax=Phytophthora megakarya TaxID=4795 RepID=A0A225VAS5_9STRA|nr:RxLR effector protein [Phytophthora megakarya]
MRISPGVLMLATSFLFATDVLSVTTDSNQAQIAKVDSIGNHRFLRIHHKRNEDGVESEDASLEERTWSLSAKSQEKLAKVAKELGIDVAKADTSHSYLLRIQQTDEYRQYVALLEGLKKAERPKKAPDFH